MARSVEHFCEAIARRAMRSVDKRMESGGGWRYVTSEMSRGISRCEPVIAKYGEQPMHLRTVTLSAQNMECAPTDHLVSYNFIEGSPSAYDVFEDPVSDSLRGFIV
jgi:hypothetical protein